MAVPSAKIGTRVTCPICSLENPPTALACDCGYNFQTKSGGKPRDPYVDQARWMIFQGAVSFLFRLFTLR